MGSKYKEMAEYLTTDPICGSYVIEVQCRG